MSPARQQPLPGTAGKMHRLEQKLAYDHCCAVLNAYCQAANNEDGETAFDLGSTAKSDEAVRSLVTEAVQYLEFRGLLERGAEAPQWVVVAPEDDAQEAA